MRANMFQAALAGSALALVVLAAGEAAARWALQTDPELGFKYSYPTEVFSPLEGDGKPYFHYFASPSSSRVLRAHATGNCHQTISSRRGKP